MRGWCKLYNLQRWFSVFFHNLLDVFSIECLINTKLFCFVMERTRFISLVSSKLHILHFFLSITTYINKYNCQNIFAFLSALVTPPNESDRGEVYELLDNGQGADIQAGDGIYSRYMTRYTTTGRYSVKAQVRPMSGVILRRVCCSSAMLSSQSRPDSLLLAIHLLFAVFFHPCLLLVPF